MAAGHQGELWSALIRLMGQLGLWMMAIQGGGKRLKTAQDMCRSLQASVVEGKSHI